jgi:hypothetical protein
MARSTPAASCNLERPALRWIALLAASSTALASPGPSLDSLSTEDLNRALETLWSRGFGAGLVDPSTARRDALRRALETLGPGTALLPPEAATPENAPLSCPLFHELLPGKIGFIRLGDAQPNWSRKLEAALRDFDQVQVRGLILDLRSSHGGSLQEAAQLASLLIAPGKSLFEARELHSQKTEAFHASGGSQRSCPHAVLINEDTAGAAEVLAALLRDQLQAILLGQPTAGAAADYAEVRLNGGSRFRYPAREALLQNGSSLFRKGLQPDLPIRTLKESESIVLQAAAAHAKVSPLLAEPTRPHFNEAALMHKKNPETEAWIQEQLSKKASDQSAQKIPRDETLVRALDFLRSLPALSSIKANPR